MSIYSRINEVFCIRSVELSAVQWAQFHTSRWISQTLLISKRKNKKKHLTVIAFTINFKSRQNSTILFIESIVILRDTENPGEDVLDAGNFCFSTWVMVQCGYSFCNFWLNSTLMFYAHFFRCMSYMVILDSYRTWKQQYFKTLFFFF